MLALAIPLGRAIGPCAANPTIIHPGRLRTSLGACEAPPIHTMLHLYSLWSLLYDEAGERSSRFAAASSSEPCSAVGGGRWAARIIMPFITSGVIRSICSKPLALPLSAMPLTSWDHEAHEASNRCASSASATAISSAARQNSPRCSSSRAVSCASTYETDAAGGGGPKSRTSTSSVPEVAAAEDAAEAEDAIHTPKV